jgi:sugar phosphate isomerase/epimerase
MKVAIDQYCFHRFFGEVYPGIETDPGSRMSFDDFIDRAVALCVEGVSLESCFQPDLTPATLQVMRSRLDAAGLDRVWAWGHPNGLASGADPAAADDLIRHIGVAEKIGARVMRICCGGRRTRPVSWPAHRDSLIPLLRKCLGPAEEHGVVLAIENHIDFLADELVELVETIDSPWLGVCLDTANNLRMLEDPQEAARKLAPFARATHVKDVTAKGGDPRTFAFWPSVPLGRGVIDLPQVFGYLKSAGYRGLLALEIDYLHPGHAPLETAVSDSIAHLRALAAT